MVNRFILQWHISEVCNLKCKHCYQENHKYISQSYDNLLEVLKQYKELLKKLKVKGHINLTGGEPLCSPFFFKLLDEFKKDKELYTFSILTNGTLINDEIAKRISSYDPYYVQVSLEGGKKTNDYIRGKGVYKKVGKAVDYLKKYNVFVSISFTATKLNYKEFPKVVSFAVKHNVDNVWSDRYIPLGNYDENLIMNLKDTQKYLDIMANEKRNLKGNTNISMYRALQYRRVNDLPYKCTAGNTLLTVMENLDLVPCRRMPIVVGNLLKDNMYDLYTNNELLIKLREENIPDECVMCDDSKICSGGLKCLTYALFKDFNHKDVGCDFEIE